LVDDRLKGDTRLKTLHQALAILGTTEALAEKLKVRPIQLAAMLSGTLPIPNRIFLQAVDIVLEASNSSQRTTPEE
jgi:hypothetical protein